MPTMGEISWAVNLKLIRRSLVGWLVVLTIGNFLLYARIYNYTHVCIMPGYYSLIIILVSAFVQRSSKLEII